MELFGDSSKHRYDASSYRQTKRVLATLLKENPEQGVRARTATFLYSQKRPFLRRRKSLFAFVNGSESAVNRTVISRLRVFEKRICMLAYISITVNLLDFLINE